MPFFNRHVSSRRGKLTNLTESTDNFEPLVDDSQDEDEIQVAESPNHGLSVDSLNLYCEPTYPSSFTTPCVREVRMSALSASSCIDSKLESLSAKTGAGKLSIDVHEVELSKHSSGFDEMFNTDIVL